MKALYLASAALAPLLVVAACNNDPSTQVMCHDIPAGGCPTENGADVCAGDLTCATVYSCVNGRWVFDQKCPPRAHDASVVDTGAGADAASGPDVQIDAPPGAYGGPGCGDLQTPDCSLGVALACANVPGCCDCDTLYVCSNGGWNVWGYCGDAGITQAP